MQINITTNIPDMQRKIDGLRTEIRDKVLASSLNKTINQAKTQMDREIRKDYNVSKAYVIDRLRVVKASAKRGSVNLEATLFGTGKRSANVIRFVEKSTTLAQARKRKKAGTLEQLHFQIKKGAGRQIIKGAFIGNKGRTVFVRTTDKRFPIKAVSTIDVPAMFNQRRINAAVQAAMLERFPVIFERDAKFFTDKFNAR